MSDDSCLDCYIGEGRLQLLFQLNGRFCYKFGDTSLAFINSRGANNQLNSIYYPVTDNWQNLKVSHGQSISLVNFCCTLDQINLRAQK